MAATTDHGPAFPQVVAEGLLAVDVLARLGRGDDRDGVPVVGSRQRNGIDVVAVVGRGVVEADVPSTRARSGLADHRGAEVAEVD